MVDESPPPPHAARVREAITVVTRSKRAIHPRIRVSHGLRSHLGLLLRDEHLFGGADFLFKAVFGVSSEAVSLGHSAFVIFPRPPVPDPLAQRRPD